MAEFTIIPYNPSHFNEWNAFVEASNEGTLFHRLDFLAYHRERFLQKEHHMLFYKGQQLFGVMPMALIPENGNITARSPYGASYGGPVFERSLDYAESKIVVASLIDYLSHLKVASCKLVLPITCCYSRYSDTFRLALLEYGFRCTNRDISSVVHLKTDRHISEYMNSRARNMARKAQKSGVSIIQHASIEHFWLVVQKTFENHGVNPTHSLDEFQWLCTNLPEQVYVDVAYIGDQPAAGIGYFVINKRVISSFYLCRDAEFQDTQAQSLLIYDALVRLQNSSFTWFDFGTSSVNMQGRENIFRFKESFGAIGLFRDTYIWNADQ